MAMMAVKVKLMPESPESDLKKIEEDAKQVLEKSGAKLHSVETEPIAFGLVAVLITFGWPEEKGMDIIEDELSSVEQVNSVEIVEMRRAIG
jgi:elongation factor 1-beta